MVASGPTDESAADTLIVVQRVVLDYDLAAAVPLPDLYFGAQRAAQLVLLIRDMGCLDP